MILNILKSEDIVFKTKSDENLVNVETIDLDKVKRIEGVSEHSVLQLEYKGETYLLTEEFSVDATLEVLDEFMEEYDEEDEDSFEFDDEEEKLILLEEEALQEEFEEELRTQEVQAEEQRQSLEQEEKIKTQEKQVEEEQKTSLETSYMLWQSSSETVGSEVSEVVETVNEELVSIGNDEIERLNVNEVSESSSEVEISEIENAVSAVEPAPILRVQTETAIEDKIAQDKLEAALVRLENEALIEGDLSLLGVTTLSDNTNTILQVNNVLEDSSRDEGRDTNQLQSIADAIVKLNAGNDLTEAEYTVLGLDNLSSEDVADLNMAVSNSNALALGTTPSTNLQSILDSLNRFDNAQEISLIDLSNIGVQGIGGENEPTLVTFNTALNTEENTNDVQALVDSLQAKESALIRLENEVLIEGDLSLLGITTLSDNANTILQVNNVLEDSSRDEGRNTAQLQSIAEAIVKLNAGNDLTETEYTVLGLDNLSSEDVADLNMAVGNSNALALGTTPSTNLQSILDSLNRFDNAETISLTDLSNIGVQGVGGENEPTLATFNAELNGEENSNDIQALVDALQAKESSTARLETESLGLGDLTVLGITGLEDNSYNTARINNILEDSDVDIGSDVTQLQAIVDVLIKIDAKDGDSSVNNITRDEWTLIGLNNVSSPDARELSIALANANSLDLGTTPLINLQLIGDSLNALDQVKYGNSTGVELSDLTNIGVTGVGGVGEPTLEAVNAVLYDDDVSADHTNSVQEIVDTVNLLNTSDGTWSINLDRSDLDTLGITAQDGNFSSDELEYINYRIGENTPAGTGNGDYVNDTIELQALVDSVDGRSIYIGSTGDDTLTYVEGELFDAHNGDDVIKIEAGTIIDLSAIHDVETIVLNSNNGSGDTSLGSADNRIDIRDVIDITDKGTTLTIEQGDSDSNSVERVYLDHSVFSADGTVQTFPTGAYHVYTANDGSGVNVRIEEQIIVE